MLVDYKKRWKKFLVAGVTMALVAGMGSTLPSAYAGGKIGTDNENQWISLGMGLRTSFAAVQDGAANGTAYNNTFGIDNARIYINGKIHKYIGFEFNTECFSCNNSQTLSAQASDSNANIGLLDAIGKFEFNPFVNIWVGRMLVPTDRHELDGPFYQAVYQGFKSPVGPADQGGFGTGGAGKYGRDNGVSFWGQVDPGFGHLQYVGMISTGLQSCGGCFNSNPPATAGSPILAANRGPGGPNQGNSLSYAGRITYNFLNPEKNPGYYTSSTYYGTAGDILAIAVGGQYQNSGAGSYFNANHSAFTSFITDLLFEKPLANDMGVITFNAEYKRYWADYSPNAFAFGDSFSMFRGQSYQLNGLFLIPQEVGIGKFQPYGMWTFIMPDNMVQGNRSEYELGTNYIISGHNARLAAFYNYGNFSNMPGGGAFANYGAGTRDLDKVSTFQVALQLQY